MDKASDRISIDRNALVKDSERNQFWFLAEKVKQKTFHLTELWRNKNASILNSHNVDSNDSTQIAAIRPINHNTNEYSPTFIRKFFTQISGFWNSRTHAATELSIKWSVEQPLWISLHNAILSHVFFSNSLFFSLSLFQSKSITVTQWPCDKWNSSWKEIARRFSIKFKFSVDWVSSLGIDWNANYKVVWQLIQTICYFPLASWLSLPISEMCYFSPYSAKQRRNIQPPEQRINNNIAKRERNKNYVLCALTWL